MRVAHAEDPDVARSAAARAAGEAKWLPRTSIVSSSRTGIDDLDFSARLEIDDAGVLQEASFKRWGDPGNNGSFGWHSFGMTATGHATFAGLTVPSAESVGWHHGTARWAEGEFFRYQLTDLQPISGTA